MQIQNSIDWLASNKSMMGVDGHPGSGEPAEGDH